MHGRLLRALRPGARTAKDLFDSKTQSLKSETAEQETEPNARLASLLETEEENVLFHEPDIDDCDDLLDEFDEFDDIDDIDDIDEEDLHSFQDDEDDARLSQSFPGNDSDISMLDTQPPSIDELLEYGSQPNDYPIDSSIGEMFFGKWLSDQISDADELNVSDLCPWLGMPFDLLSQGDHEESLFSDNDKGLYFTS